MEFLRKLKKLRSKTITHIRRFVVALGKKMFYELFD